VTGAGAHLGVWGTVGIVAGAVGVGLGIGLTALAIRRGMGATQTVPRAVSNPRRLGESGR